MHENIFRPLIATPHIMAFNITNQNLHITPQKFAIYSKFPQETWPMAILKEEILNYNSLNLQPTSFISIYVISSKGLNRHKKEKQITKQIVPSYFSGLCYSTKQNKD